MAKNVDDLYLDLELLREEYHALGEKVSEAYRKWDDALTAQVEDQVEFDVAALVEHAHSNSAAHQKIESFAKSLGLHDFNYYGSYDHPYAVIGPKFILGKNEDVSTVVAGIREFCRVFEGYTILEAEDEDEIRIDFLENTLSEYGVYSISWKPDTDEARVNKVTYGHLDIIAEGSLEQMVQYVAQNHYYGEPYAESEDDDDMSWYR